MKKTIFLFMGLCILVFCCCTKTTITVKNASADEASRVWVGKDKENGEYDSVFFGSLDSGATSSTRESDFYGLGFVQFTIRDSTYRDTNLNIVAYNDNCFSFDTNGLSECAPDSTGP